MSTVFSQARSDQTLPEAFQDLEEFAAVWSRASERERNRQRLSSSMAEIQALYDALLPRMDAIIGYLNTQPLNNMSDEARRLFHLSLSLAEIAPAVEFYKQPEVIDGFPPERFVPVEVPYMTPKEG
ncbi:MAG: hypothetical protein ABR555_06400 [Pyrinomonadaceae bacterium]